VKAALAVAVVCALATVARAQDATNDVTIIRVKPGDTLPILASEFYGDRNKAIFIMVKNRITHERALRPGERLKIPVNRPITTSPDDTFQTLAATYLGDARRGPFLAEFNNLSFEDSLPAGTALLVPFTVQHEAQGTESLQNIALAYFNDAKIAELLRRYNFLEKTALDRGERITVPVFNVRLQAAKMPPLADDAKTRQAIRRSASQDAASAIPQAWHAWRTGEYRAIEVLLKKIDIDYLDQRQAIDVGILRGLAHIAENKLELAGDDFKSVLDRHHDHALRRFDYSPKVLAVWEKAGGKLE
jgi:LysM repeat protein